MKRKIVFGLLLLVGSLLIAEKMPKKLVSEEVKLPYRECRYWEFIVPNTSNYIEIECTSNDSLYIAVVVPTKKDAFSFCNDKGFDYIKGTLMVYEKDEWGNPKPFENYHIKLSPSYCEQGEILYFCIFGNSNILVEITAYQTQVYIINIDLLSTYIIK